LTLELDGAGEFNVIRIQEPIAMGQRIAAYRVEAHVDGAWKTVSEGSTIGHKKLDRLAAPVSSGRVRLVILDALAPPLIAELGLHFDPHAARR
jgi:alpha-L-fucosidase